MSLVEELKRERERLREDLSRSEEFIELEDFYLEMQKLGVAKSAKYDLPPIDTLGKRFYDIQHSSNKKNSFV